MPRTLTYWSAVGMTLKGSPAFEVKGLTGSEGLGELFNYTVTLQTPDSPDLTSVVSANLPIKDMVGKEAGLKIELDGGAVREINGLVTSARYLHAENRRSLYEVTLEPWLSLATRTSDYKIFQNKTVIEITQEVLGGDEYPFVLELQLSQSYPKRIYQVQYGETDFEFLSRLWQEWGVYYYFKHEGGKHKLVLVDDAGAHPPCDGVYARINYYGPGAKIQEEYCNSFQVHDGLQPGVWVTDDYDFQKPKARLQQKIKMPRKTGNESFEIYRWPGDYIVADEGHELARVRMEEAGAPGQRSVGSGNLRGIVTGKTFILGKHPQFKANQSYLVIASTLSMQENSHAAGEEGYSCHCQFYVQPAQNTYRHPQTQAKPHTSGPQTAIVTGPAGEEIYTDQYGRVKVQFHWDRYGLRDENSSMWIRVSSPWAGNQFGGIAIPRIGQEVIVDFVNGDPDKPIITGRVYNALNMPPWSLPGNMTQSGILTRSTMGGTPGPGIGMVAGVGGTANALRFEDKKGAEQLWLHAEKDQLTEVEHDEDKWVGNDRRKTVDGNETNVIHKNRTETVDIDETITVHGHRSETVDLNQSETVHQNDTQTIDLNQSLTVHKNRTRTVDLNESVSVGINRSKNVGVNESDTIGANWSIKTGQMKNEHVGVGYMQTTGLFKMVNIGVAYNLNVGAVMMSNVGMLRMDTVGMNWTRNTGADETIQVGSNQSVTVGAEHCLKVGASSKTDAGTNAETKAGAKIKGEAPEIELIASGTLKLTCGGSTIVMTPGSIELKSPVIQINP